jgi:hypothetical protein
VIATTGKLRERLHDYVSPDVLVIDEVGYLSYGADAANLLFHVVNERHQKKRAMLFTTNKSTNEWGNVLHDHDLAEVIVDRILERGRTLKLDGPSHRTRHLGLDGQPQAEVSTKPDRISGIQPAEFPEPTRGAPCECSRGHTHRSPLNTDHPPRCSICRPSIFAKPLRFEVNTVKLSEIAVAAMMRSCAPTVRPLFASAAQILA